MNQIHPFNSMFGVALGYPKSRQLITFMWKLLFDAFGFYNEGSFKRASSHSKLISKHTLSLFEIEICGRRIVNLFLSSLILFFEFDFFK